MELQHAGAAGSEELKLVLMAQEAFPLAGSHWKPRGIQTPAESVEASLRAA
jgi:hypothetical protein